MHFWSSQIMRTTDVSGFFFLHSCKYTADSCLYPSHRATQNQSWSHVVRMRMTEIELHFSLSLTAKFKYYHSTFVSRPQLESDSKIWVKALSICTKKKKSAERSISVHSSSFQFSVRDYEACRAQSTNVLLYFNL